MSRSKPFRLPSAQLYELIVRATPEEKREKNMQEACHFSYNDRWVVVNWVRGQIGKGLTDLIMAGAIPVTDVTYETADEVFFAYKAKEEQRAAARAAADAARTKQDFDNESQHITELSKV